MPGSLEQSFAHPWCIYGAIDSLLWPRCAGGAQSGVNDFGGDGPEIVPGRVIVIAHVGRLISQDDTVRHCPAPVPSCSPLRPFNMINSCCMLRGIATIAAMAKMAKWQQQQQQREQLQLSCL